MAKKVAKKSKPRAASGPQKTVIVRGEEIAIIEAWGDTQLTKPPFVAAMRYFMNLGIDEYEETNGPIMGDQFWKEIREEKDIKVREGRG